MPNTKLKAPFLFGGISKQPEHIRRLEQVEDSRNAVFSVRDGFRKRPGTRWIVSPSGLTAGVNYRLLPINRDETERYLVLYGGGLLRVFETNGTERAVTPTAAATAYLASSSPTADDLRLSTIADSTFILNTLVPVEAKTSTSYGVTRVYKDFDVMISHTPASLSYHKADKATEVRTPGYYQYVVTDTGWASWNGPVMSGLWTKTINARWDSNARNPMGMKITFRDRFSVSTTYEITEDFRSDTARDMYEVALRLQRQLQAAGALDALINWQWTGVDVGRFQVVAPYRGTVAAVISFAAPTTTPVFNLTASGNPFFGAGGTFFAGTGDPASQTQAVLSRWLRVPAPGQVEANLDETTMPVKMVRNFVGPTPVFDVDVIEWGFRQTGDEDTNPVPSLWKKRAKLADISFHRNRLVLAGDENIVFSQAGNFFDFYIEDDQEVVDSDPIDVELSANEVTLTDFIVPFRKAMAIWTKAGRQFELNAPEALTHKTAAITPTTNKHSQAVRPAPMGNRVYFASSEAGSATIQEYFFDDNQASTDTGDVTAHVFGLLPDTVRTLATAPNRQTLVVLPANTANDHQLYVYRVHFKGLDKEQSAWSIFELPSTERISDIAIIENDMYLLIDTAAGYVIERMPLSREVPTTGWAYVVHLDRQATLTGVYAAGPNKTTWTQPFSDSTPNTVVLGPAFGASSGLVLTPTRISATTVEIAGDFSAGQVVLGRKYTKSVELSRVFHQDANRISDIEGTVFLREMLVQHSESGEYKLRLVKPGRADRVLTFTPPTGTLIEALGQMRMHMIGDTRDARIFVENDSPKPSTISTVDYVADYTTRAR